VTALIEALLLGIRVVGCSGVPVGMHVSVLVGPNALLSSPGGFLDGGLAFRASHIGKAVDGCMCGDVCVGMYVRMDGLGRCACGARCR